MPYDVKKMDPQVLAYVGLIFTTLGGLITGLSMILKNDRTDTAMINAIQNSIREGFGLDVEGVHN